MQRFVDLEAVSREAERVWAVDASIRAEFGRKDVYLAFCRAEAKSRGHKVAAAGSGSAFRAADPEATWESDPAVRAEFGGDKSAYLALRRAEDAGAVKVRAPGRTAAAGARPAADVSQVATAQAAGDLTSRQASVRQENVGRQFAGLPPLPIPQQ